MFNRHASRQSPRPSVIKNSGLLCPASSSASQSCQPQPVDRVEKGLPPATLKICRARSITVGRTMDYGLWTMEWRLVEVNFWTGSWTLTATRIRANLHDRNGRTCLETVPEMRLFTAHSTISLFSAIWIVSKSLSHEPLCIMRNLMKHLSS